MKYWLEEREIYVGQTVYIKVSPAPARPPTEVCSDSALAGPCRNRRNASELARGQRGMAAGTGHCTVPRLMTRTLKLRRHATGGEQVALVDVAPPDPPAVESARWRRNAEAAFRRPEVVAPPGDLHPI